jgi:heterodisulfide reductase subunit A
MEKIHTTNPPAPAVMVAGGGISGMAAAMTLAEIGYPVWLVDRGPATAGILNSLDHQFPDNHCGMCRLLPMVDRSGGPQTCLRKGVFHDRIQVLSLTTVR